MFTFNLIFKWLFAGIFLTVVQTPNANNTKIEGKLSIQFVLCTVSV